MVAPIFCVCSLGTVEHDHLDDLLSTMRMHVELMKEVSSCCGAVIPLSFTYARQVPGLVGADIDSAFRRVPLNPKHHWAAGVAYHLEGRPVVSFHKSMPFGATASVYARHRVGDLILTIPRKSLKIPMSRYMDDYFCPERSVHSGAL